MTLNAFAVFLLVLICLLHSGDAQYRDYTDKYAEVIRTEKNLLNSKLLDAYPDLNQLINPESVLLYNDGFRFDYPISDDYRINILIDPCRGHADNDCCLNVFGTPEYTALKVAGHTQERVVQYKIIGDETEVSSNYDLVYEDSSTVPVYAQRTADNYEQIDLECTGVGEPYSFCRGKNYALGRSPLVPACTDNNQSMNTLESCVHPNGTVLPTCSQVAYAQNAFIGECGIDDPHCGTFLEVHQIQGTPYSEENDVITDVRIETRDVSGFYTTTIPMTWKGDPNKVLCAYTESYIRVGSIVYIKPSVPVCCCAKPFKPATRVGGVQCPIGSVGGGAFAFKSQNMAQTLRVDSLYGNYPYCPIDLDSDIDKMMCSVYESKDRRHFIRTCDTVTQWNPAVWRTWSSLDLDGKEYDGVCPYFDECALTLDDGKCKGEDLVYSFIGRVGRVTFVDDVSLIPKVRVTFNDGRTSYLFNKDQVELEYTLSMFEIWWTLRTPSEFVVQKRKGFNITSPKCTFDIVNNRYFPYTLLIDGVTQDSATSLQ